jgi:hypothetical protein
MLWAIRAPNIRWPIFVTLVDALLEGYDEVSPRSCQERQALGPALLINERDGSRGAWVRGA